MQKAMSRLHPIPVLVFLAALLLAGCKDRDDRIRTDQRLTPGETTLITVEDRVCDFDDTLWSVSASLRQGDLNNLDISFISTGIKDENHGFTQLQITAHSDAPAGLYVVIVELHATYYDGFFEDARSGTTEATITIEVI
jgi:hypothetical protein